MSDFGTLTLFQCNEIAVDAPHGSASTPFQTPGTDGQIRMPRMSAIFIADGLGGLAIDLMADGAILRQRLQILRAVGVASKRLAQLLSALSPAAGAPISERNSTGISARPAGWKDIRTRSRRLTQPFSA